MAEGHTDGINITIVGCDKIAKNAKFDKYYCLDLTTIPNDLKIDSEGNYNQIYIRQKKKKFLI
jgi:hypothetical protein